MQLPKDIIELIHRYVIDEYRYVNQQRLLYITSSIKWKLAYRHTYFSHEPPYENHNTEVGRRYIRDSYKRCKYDPKNWTLSNQIFVE